jgi:putative ABC transport system permease protein
MNSLWQDVRYGLRMLIKRPGFTAVIVATLALGIGANTAIFSVVDGVLLRPLPFPQPEQLVLVRDDLSGRKLENIGMSVDELRDFQEKSGVFDQISAVWPVDANLTGSDRPERVELLAVSPNYFALLGAHAQLGRVFDAQDRADGFAEAVVISDGLWHRLFGADPNILGRRIQADNDAYTIVGVMPPGFRHPGQTLRNDVELWGTAGFAANPFGPPVRAQRILPGAIGRLKPGLDVRQAQVKLDTFVANLRSEYPKDYPPDAGWKVQLLPAQKALIGKVRTTLLVLLGAVGLVLLLCCVNIANLLLARTSARQREIAVRLALGAGRGRLVRQLLTESLLLALLGGAAALLVVSWAISLLLRLVPTDIPRLHEVGINGSVLGFTLLVSVVTGVLFGLVPALQSSRPDLLANLKDGSLGSGFGLRHQRFRNTLVVAEFALSLMLMVGAGLLLRSFWKLLEVNPGFNPQRVLMARIWLPVPNNPELNPYRPVAKRAAFVSEVLRRVSSLPGVQYAAMGGGNGVPLIGPHNSGAFTIENRAEEPSNLPLAQISSVSADYFRVLGTPLIRGRFFADSDDTTAPPAALIDEAMARRYWPNEDPVGRRIKFGRQGSKAPWMAIAGIVGNIKTDGFEVPDQPHLYVPILQNPGVALAVYLRTTSNPEILTQSVRQQVQAVDPNLPVFGERTMEDLVAASLAQRRFAMQMVSIFGLVALLLAGIGIYGVISYSVTQRTREIGIRIALGAQPRDVLRLVVGQGMILSLIGSGIGVVLTVLLTRFLASLLFGISPNDPLTLVVTSLLLMVVAALACYFPARRATKVDPMVALRDQ